MPTLGEKITRRLGELDLSQTDLASHIKKAQSRISKWIGGTGHPEPEILLQIARFLEVPVEYLCDPQMADPEGGARSIHTGPPVEGERLLWEAVRRLGVDESLRRLIGAQGTVAWENQPPKGFPPARRASVLPSPAAAKAPGPKGATRRKATKP
jgi:transcriptional regulator with XRE-family HTH domain